MGYHREQANEVFNDTTLSKQEKLSNLYSLHEYGDLLLKNHCLNNDTTCEMLNLCSDVENKINWLNENII